MEKWLRKERLRDPGRHGPGYRITFGHSINAGYSLNGFIPPGDTDRLDMLMEHKYFTNATWMEFIDRRFWFWSDEEK